MSYDQWLEELADILHTTPQDLHEDYPQLKRLVYDANASPREAADMLRYGL